MMKQTMLGRALRPAATTALPLLLATVLLMPAVARGGEDEEARSSAKPEKAKAEAAGEKKTEPELTGRNATLAREAGLKPKQKKQLARTVAEAGQAMVKWQEENREAIQAANKALSAARQAGDREAMQQAMTDARPLMEARRAVRQKYEQKIMDLLTPTQEARWLGYVLYDQMVRQAEVLGMSEKQKTKTRALCDATGKKLAALPPPTETTPEDSQKAARLQQSMINQFVNEILTDDQREQLRPSGAAPPTGAPGESSGKPTAEEAEPTGEPTDAKDKPPTPKG